MLSMHEKKRERLWYTLAQDPTPIKDAQEKNVHKNLED